MNWKFRQFATHRRDFDRDALRMESDPPPVVPEIPKYPGLGQESAVRRSRSDAEEPRAGDTDLVVPAGQRERYEAAFARFSSVFPTRSIFASAAAFSRTIRRTKAAC